MSDPINLSSSIVSDFSEIAYPFRISPRNFETEVTMLPYLGEKIISKVRLV